MTICLYAMVWCYKCFIAKI